MKLCPWLVLGLFLFGCSSQQNKIFPENEWLISTPEEQGVDEVKLQEAIKYLESECNENGVDELVIIRKGYMIYRGSQADSTHELWSMSKTFTSTVLGLLIDDGILDLNESAAKYEPLLREKYPEITFRHFTTMTSGYSAVGESRWPGTDYADWSWTIYNPDDPYFAPGTEFAYWDEAQIMFGRVLTQVLRQPMYNFLSERIMNVIGITNWSWGTEKEIENTPINIGCGGISMNAEQMARWGYLFLNKGKWKDEQLLSEEWVEKATNMQVSSTIPVADTDRKDLIGPGCYGFNWWINGILADGTQKLPGAPSDCYFASGFNNNKCFIIPSWDMVIVRMGQDRNLENADAIYGKFLQMIGTSILAN